jgi:hypothetical protein
MEVRGSYLFVLLAILTGAAGAILWAENRAQRQPHAEEFQRLVGGVGFGPAVDLSGCPFSFDPRLADSCAQDSSPIPGGSCFCSRHGTSIFFYPPLDPPRSSLKAEDGRASVP